MLTFLTNQTISSHLGPDPRTGCFVEAERSRYDLVCLVAPTFVMLLQIGGAGEDAKVCKPRQLWTTVSTNMRPVGELRAAKPRDLAFHREPHREASIQLSSKKDLLMAIPGR